MVVKKHSILALVIGASSFISVAPASAGPVETRIEEMEKVGRALKALNLRTRSQQVSAQQAKQAVALIKAVALNTPALFEVQDMSGASEAKPEIWTNWDDFVAQSQELAAYTDNLDQAVNDQDRLAAEIKKIGEICSACHRKYRE